MRKVFDETVINGMSLKNRLVRSATWEGMCEIDGRPTERLTNCYRDLAKGQVGLIITGYAFVSPEGKQLPGKMGLYSDDFAAEMTAMTETVHAEGGKICIQLAHAGGQTDSRNAGRAPLAPSVVKVDQYPEKTDKMSFADIQRVVKDFSNAARRAKEYGFDAVQLQGAHGYLINQFLSPLTNRRTDEYGGSIDQRCRFMMEVYWAVRDVVGKDYPVMVKLNGSDNIERGLELKDSVYVARFLDKEGIDAIEVSGGTPASGKMSPVRKDIDTPEKEAYNMVLAKGIKAAVKCPVMVVGGFRSFEVVEESVRDDVDYVSMARPFIREPDLAGRWQSGDHSPARCISCNACFVPGLKEGGIYCVVERKEKEKRERQHD